MVDKDKYASVNVVITMMRRKRNLVIHIKTNFTLFFYATFCARHKMADQIMSVIHVGSILLQM